MQSATLLPARLDALHSAVFAVVRCLSVRLSHAGIVSKRLNLSQNFLPSDSPSF